MEKPLIKQIKKDLRIVRKEFDETYMNLDSEDLIKTFRDNKVGLRVYVVNHEGGVALTHTCASIFNVYTIDDNFKLEDKTNPGSGVYSYYGDRKTLTNMLKEAIEVFENYR